MIEQSDPQADEQYTSHCSNCQQALIGPYCHHCGQAKKSQLRFFSEVFHDLLGSLYSYDSKINQTIWPIIFSPWRVTCAYLAGQRARFLHPFRLYLFASLVFFLLIPNLPTHSSIVFEQTNETAVAEISEKPAASAENLEHSIREKLLIAQQHPDRLVDDIIQRLPSTLFVLLPLLALVSKLFYPSNERYYTEHLVVILYLQSFLFFNLMLSSVSASVAYYLNNTFADPTFASNTLSFISQAINCWIVIGFYITYKKVYGDKHVITLVKTLALISLFSLLLLISFIATAGFSLMNF